MNMCRITNGAMPQMIGKLRTMIRLAPADQCLAFGAIALMAVVRIALWILPFRWIRRSVEACGPSRLVAGKFTAQQTGWAVRLAGRHLPGTTCLTQALTAQVLLNWSSVGSRLHIGVALGPKFESHAWVESGGRILVGGAGESARYLPMLSLEGRIARA